MVSWLLHCALDLCQVKLVDDLIEQHSSRERQLPLLTQVFLNKLHELAHEPVLVVYLERLDAPEDRGKQSGMVHRRLDSKMIQRIFEYTRIDEQRLELASQVLIISDKEAYGLQTCDEREFILQVPRLRHSFITSVVAEQTELLIDEVAREPFDEHGCELGSAQYSC